MPLDIGSLVIDLTGATAFDIAGGGYGLALAAVQSGPAGPSTLYGLSLITGAVTLYRNGTGNAAASQVGGAGGPLLIDLAIRL